MQAIVMCSRGHGMDVYNGLHPQCTFHAEEVPVNKQEAGVYWTLILLKTGTVLLCFLYPSGYHNTWCIVGVNE